MVKSMMDWFMSLAEGEQAVIREDKWMLANRAFKAGQETNIPHDEWSTEFPKEEGMFWFYGYRYGKISCGQKSKPELLLIKVNKTRNGYIHVSEGQFMFEDEVEEPHFIKATLPSLPEIGE